MTLQQMEYIVALDQHRHFVNAAEACGVTQPSLSSAIQKLEDELGVRIFNRQSHPITPTEAGLRILRQARTVLREAERIPELVAAESGELATEVRVGVIPTVAPYLVPCFIAAFRQAHPAAALSLTEARTHALIYQLETAQLDMALLATPLNKPQLLEVPLYYEPFVAYFAPHTPPQDKDLHVSDLPGEQLWVLQEGHCLRNQVFRFCGKEGRHNPTYEAGSIDTLIRIVDCNGGYTLIPELHLPLLSPQQRSGVVPLSPPAPVREISLVFRADYIRERTLNAVADVIKKLVPAHMLDERLKKFAIKL